ncbi:CpsB/CapC family capsule biosynthesis tyrosine phosphatase [Flavobacterium buctense]|uniref:protein-tyrosine-phosphatase n=1 Tax=Flavobacterium buctense TaxID=1648146 RepID=A0ABU9E2I9_9FLAO|nr:CpsB/CapC family capsule biosynthesis tyrosine phosphatase [Flavobacterium buctense]
MIQLFKPKPTLCDLIPNNHIDIHSHLLPGIDDGATSLENSLALIHQMSEMGFKNIITTPHIISNVWNNSESSILKKQLEVSNYLQEKNEITSFKAAAEYMMDDSFLKRIGTEKLLTLKDNYVLVEMSYLSPPIQLYDIIFEIQLAGYKPILAHPERYLFYHLNFKEYYKLKNAGCLFQLNLIATVDYYGKNVRLITDKLLSNDYYDFVGSDIHHQNHINAFKNKVKVKSLLQLEKAIHNNLFFLE